MTQAQFNLEESEIQFLNRYREYGFRDRDKLVPAVLKKFKEELKTRNLEKVVERQLFV
jgi:hypothetical protein